MTVTGSLRQLFHAATASISGACAVLVHDPLGQALFGALAAVNVLAAGITSLKTESDSDCETATSGVASTKPGEQMPDGTIFAGISPETGKPMYTTPADAPLTLTFSHVGVYASGLDANGHRDWRVPTANELNALFNNRAAIRGFDLSGSYPAGWYWSSEADGFQKVRAERFSDGLQNWYGMRGPGSLRCVRG